MREVITKVYNFNELSDEAKEKAIKAHRFDFCDAWNWENWASIRAIAKACSLEIMCDDYNDTGFWRFRLGNIDNYLDINMLGGVRAMSYIYNNWIMPNMNGKYYSALVSRNERELVYRKRYSKCTFVFDCPFTGYGLDNCIPEAYNEFCELVRKTPRNANVATFIDILSQHVQKWLQNDYDNAISDENIASMLDCNDYEFFIDGRDCNIC